MFEDRELCNIMDTKFLRTDFQGIIEHVIPFTKYLLQLLWNVMSHTIIERLWKYMRKKVIDRRYYETKDEFRGAIRRFFNYIEEYRPELERLLTLNFHVL